MIARKGGRPCAMVDLLQLPQGRLAAKTSGYDWSRREQAGKPVGSHLLVLLHRSPLAKAFWTSLNL